MYLQSVISSIVFRSIVPDILYYQAEVVEHGFEASREHRAAVYTANTCINDVCVTDQSYNVFNININNSQKCACTNLALFYRHVSLIFSERSANHVRKKRQTIICSNLSIYISQMSVIVLR